MRTLVAAALLLACAGMARAQDSAAAHPHDSTRASVRDSLRVVPHDSVRVPVRICAGGDVTLGTNLDTVWASAAARSLRTNFGLSDEPDTLLAPLRPLFAGADVVLVNAEGAIGEGPAPQKCGPRSRNCFAFRQPGSTAAALRRLNDSAVVVANVANNHSRDAGNEGLDSTLAYLTRAGVAFTGDDTLATPVAVRGDTIAFLGFYTSKDTPDARDLDAVRRHVGRAVARWGTAVVTMHLGAEGVSAQRTRRKTELFLKKIDRGNPVAFADAALDAGATMVIGHGPHVLRAASWRDERLVIYSLGNLVTYGPFRLREPMNRGAVVCASVVRDTVRDVRVLPTVQRSAGVVAPDSSARAVALIDSLSRLDFPRKGARLAADGTLLSPAMVESARAKPAPQPAGEPIPVKKPRAR